jgi:cellulose synthase/poly-beta-1,6-N-acetylglucosamine synthase-like glycosyltransferase
VCTALLVYTYAGYPALLAVLSRKRPLRTARIRPRLSILLAARDEARVLGRKIESILAQDYPRSLVEIIVVSDGSRDATVAIAKSFGTAVRVLLIDRPLGKPAALNQAVAHASGELLVLTDARQPLLPGALTALVEAFADRDVGAATGELEVPEGGSLGFYRRYDDWIRRAEARRGSSIGVTGALWALRRECFTPIPVGALADDLFLPMMVIAQRKRVVCVPAARCLDTMPRDPRADFRRRVRTLAGNFQLVGWAPWLLSPRRNPAFFAFLSHKALRLLSPVLLGGMLAASLLREGPLFAAALAAQVLLYGFALAGCFAQEANGLIAGLCRAALAFVMVNVAILAAGFQLLRGRSRTLWRPVPEVAP